MADDYVYAPDDELGQVEAAEVPTGDVEADEYVEDSDYNPGNDALNGAHDMGPEGAAE